MMKAQSVPIFMQDGPLVLDIWEKAKVKLQSRHFRQRGKPEKLNVKSQQTPA